jgi:uncharacterized repeat protein (TIGR04052 family)
MKPIRLILFCLVILAAAGSVYGQHEGMGQSQVQSDGLTTIRFAAMVGERPAACGTLYEGIGAGNSPMELTDFRFYVSNIELINAAGDAVPLELQPDGLWQQEQVALLDFEDGSARCAEFGNEQLRSKVVGTAPEGDYTGIRFRMDVPFELNHLDVTAAPSPLNIPALWWNWQFGYKFTRIEMMVNGEPWLLHLGSTGCEAPNGASAPEHPCANTNAVQVELDGFNPRMNFIVADVAALLATVDISSSTPEPPGCMSGLDDPDCVVIFTALGLSLETGAILEDAPQTFFRVQ